MLRNHYFAGNERPSYYVAELTAAEFLAQLSPEWQREIVGAVTVEYLWRPDGQHSYGALVKYRADDGLMEMLHFRVTVKSSQQQAVDSLLAEQKRALAFGEGGAV